MRTSRVAEGVLWLLLGAPSIAGVCLPLEWHSKRREYDITLITCGWASNDVVTHALAIVLEEVLGYSVFFAPTNSWLESVSMLHSEVAQVQVEAWNINVGSARYNAHCCDGCEIECVGGIGHGGSSGLFVFDHTVAKYPIADYYKFFQAVFCGAAQTWTEFLRLEDVNMTGKSSCSSAWCNGSVYIPPICQNNPNDCPVILSAASTWDPASFEARVLNHNMKLITLFVGWGWDSDDGEVQTFYRQGRNLVFYNYQPNLIFSKVAATRLAFPPYHMGCPEHTDTLPSPVWCDYPEHPLTKVADPVFRYKAPEAFRVVQGFSVDQTSLDMMFHSLAVQGSDYNQAACAWLQTLGPRWWAEVVPHCLRDQKSNPQPGDMVFNKRDLVCEQQLGSVNCTNGTTYMVSLNKCVCTAGQYLDSDAATCVSCPAGRSADIGMKDCEPCVAGTFSAKLGERECKRCALGKYSLGVGYSECIQCVSGMTTEETGAASPMECVCPAGDYAHQGVCKKCPDGMDCAIGSNASNFPLDTSAEEHCANKSRCEYPKLRPGYTSLSRKSVDEALKVYACISELCCPGGEPAICAEHRVGIACGACGDGWFDYDNVCQPCTEEVTRAQVTIPAILLVLVLCVGMYAAAKHASGKGAQSWGKAKHVVCVLFVIAFTYVQSSALLYKLSFDPPKLLESAGTCTQWSLRLWSIINKKCAMDVSLAASIVIELLGPLYFGCIVLLSFVVSKAVARLIPKIKGIEVAMDLDATIGTFGAFYSTFITAITVHTSELFVCFPHPNQDGEASLKMAPQVLCYKGEWNTVLAPGVFGVLFFIAMPYCLCIYIVQVAPRFINELSFQVRWKFLLSKHAPHAYYFQLITLARGIWMPLAFVAFDYVTGQICWMYAGLFFHLMCVSLIKPYISSTLLIADTTVHVALTLIFAWAPFLANKSALSDRDFERLGVATTITLIMPFVVLASMGCPIALEAAKELAKELLEGAETLKTTGTVENAGDAMVPMQSAVDEEIVALQAERDAEIAALRADKNSESALRAEKEIEIATLRAEIASLRGDHSLKDTIWKIDL